MHERFNKIVDFYQMDESDPFTDRVNESISDRMYGLLFESTYRDWIDYRIYEMLEKAKNEMKGDN